MKTLLVALIGLINENNEVLISLRKNRSQYNNFWEFPGGKVEERETFISALIREIKEELSLEIQVGNKITTISLDASDKRISVHYFYALIVSGQISLNVHSEFRWVVRSQLSMFNYIDGDRHILEHL